MSMKANTCPCCGASLLRHVRQGELYWFCQSCRQEVPQLTVSRLTNPETRTTGVLTPQQSILKLPRLIPKVQSSQVPILETW